jgi:fatty-acyl-CoA synthase
MSDILAQIGPVVAIGKPSEPVPQLGAACLYVSNDEWQRKVAELMAAARLVVVRVGASPGLLWEIEQALAKLPRQRLALAVLGGSAVAPELVARALRPTRSRARASPARPVLCADLPAGRADTSLALRSCALRLGRSCRVRIAVRHDGARVISPDTTGTASMNIYEQDLGRNAANFVALSPVSFVERSAEVFSDLEAVVHGARRYSWRQTRNRSARLAAALAAFGVGRGTTVSVMLHNTPEMVEAHYAVPALNAVLNTLNTRLDAALIAWQMNHCEAAVLLTDRELAPTVAEALRILREEHGRTPVVVDVCDSEFVGSGERIGAHEYEALLASHAPLARLAGPQDEWDAIAISYTSGTTGDPKGVVTHHRGAYLNAVCNAATWTMPHFPRYLWTLPMFHCNGWCFPWTIALLGGTHICLRKVEAQAIFDAMRNERVDHYCAAPIVHNMLIAAPQAMRAGIAQKVRAMVAGAAPPAAMIEGMARIGFDITHVYGLTEVYGPASVTIKRNSWAEESIAEQTRLNGRQGVRYALEEGMTVMNAASMREVPADGETIGEIMFRGNIVMTGYLKNAKATDEAFAGGWFHTGDLAVIEPDRYVKIKDRSKDIIISGGENISSLEVEDALYRHAAVLVCAVVARPDPKWGETPIAFVELKPGAQVAASELVAHCKQLLAGYKVPREIRFEAIPKTSTGKIQKFQLREKARQAVTDQETR